MREVMTPRPDIVAIQAEATLAELLALFREQEYSRIPVFKENLDNILGIVFVKDLVVLAEANTGEQPITPLVRPAVFVPETKRVPELLKEFQRRQAQMAIVVDEYGGTAGLVTSKTCSRRSSARSEMNTMSRASPLSTKGTGRGSSARRRASTRCATASTSQSSRKASRRSAATC